MQPKGVRKPFSLFLVGLGHLTASGCIILLSQSMDIIAHGQVSSVNLRKVQ